MNGVPLFADPDTVKKRRRRKRYKAEYGVQLYDREIVGVAQGYRCFAVVKTGRKWVHLVDTANQTAHKCRVELWNKLVRKGHAFDAKGRRI